MEKKKPSSDILNKIKEEKIMPKSHFQVHWKNYVFWFVWCVIMIFGAISFSLILLNVLDIRPEFLREIGIGRYMRLFGETMPFLWIILVLVAFGTGYMAMRKTRKGYRYSMIFVTTIIVLIMSLLGALFHMTKLNKQVGGRMINNESMMRMGFPAQERMMRPGEGMMGGRVVSFSDTEIFVENIRGDEWKIIYDKKTKMQLKEDLRTDLFIAVTGEKIDKDVFHADAIFCVPDHMDLERKPKKDGDKTPLPPVREMNVDSPIK